MVISESRARVSNGEAAFYADVRFVGALSILRGYLAERPFPKTPEQIAIHANELQETIAQRLHVEGGLRQIDSRKIEELASVLGGYADYIILMRHGAQDFPRNGLSAEAAKIRMMQPFNNWDDPLTPSSIAESCGAAYALNSILKQGERQAEIRSSGNARAAQLANLIAQDNPLNMRRVLLDSRLDCVDYPDLPVERVAELLGEENKGSLPWEKDVVDRVCGEGKYDEILRDTTSFLGEGNGVLIGVTHTQQTNAIDMFTGNKPERYSELGFRVVPRQAPQKSVLFKHGLYASA